MPPPPLLPPPFSFFSSSSFSSITSFSSSSSSASSSSPCTPTHPLPIVLLFLLFPLRIATIEVQIAKLDSEAWPGLLDPERDRLILINEKEELLKELQYVNPRQRLEPNDAERLESQKKRLERDLQAARDSQSKALTERWEVHCSQYHCCCSCSRFTSSPVSSSCDRNKKSVSCQQHPAWNPVISVELLTQHIG